MCFEQSTLQMVETLLSKSPDITVLAEGGLRLRLGTVPAEAGSPHRANGLGGSLWPTGSYHGPVVRMAQSNVRKKNY